MKRMMWSALVLTCCCPMVLGGPLELETVAGDAVWVAHLDAKELLKSGIAKFLLEEAEKKPEFLQGIEKMREVLGLDPLEDVKSITIYGKKFGDDSGVVVLDAAVQQDKLKTLLEANETHKTSEYGDFVLHEWVEPAKRVTDKKTGKEVVKPAQNRFGCFYSENRVLIATSADLLKGAIDVLEGKADSLAKSDALKTLPKPVAGVFLTIAAEKIKMPVPADRPQAALLRGITDLSLQLGETEGDMFLHVTALVETAEKATKLRQVAQGFIALGQMMLQERQDLPVLGEKIQVGGKENVVELDAEVATESLVKMIRHLIERKKQMAGGAARP